MYVEKSPIGLWVGCGSILTHRWVPAKAGQAVPTAQSPVC